MSGPSKAAGFAAIYAAAFPQSRPWSAVEIEGLLCDPTTVCVTEGPAFAIGRVVLDEAELLTIACPPAAQGQGHGRAALCAFEAQVTRLNATRVFLEVAQDNAIARALYKGAGYAEIGRRKGYYTTQSGTKTDALVLGKPLS